MKWTPHYTGIEFAGWTLDLRFLHIGLYAQRNKITKRISLLRFNWCLMSSSGRNFMAKRRLWTLPGGMLGWMRNPSLPFTTGGWRLFFESGCVGYSERGGWGVCWSGSQMEPRHTLYLRAGRVYFAANLPQRLIPFTYRVSELIGRVRLWVEIRRKAEGGEVAVVHNGMDCDCSRWEGVVVYLPANLKEVEGWVESFYDNAEGPQGHYLEYPSVAASLRSSSRDLALEAFENGHPHSIHY